MRHMDEVTFLDCKHLGTGVVSAVGNRLLAADSGAPLT